jgi:hypothetical protein|tara:strand:- start:102 stop:566 length:465 start_codon:yes stop_codon:yes gene_type:complete
MKKLTILLGILLSYAMTTNGQATLEIAANMSHYNSLSIGFEKMFSYKKFKFGPSVEYLSLGSNEEYNEDGDTFLMNAQYRIRLLQIEYPLHDKVTIGLSPVWMLGPIPRKGLYMTPFSAYVRFELLEYVFVETTFTNSKRESIQLSLIARISTK